MKTVNEIMREFYGEFKMAAGQKKNFSIKDLINEQKTYEKYFGQMNKLRVARTNDFTNGLKEHFGKEKMLVLVGTIGKLDYSTVTGYIVMNENFIKNSTVEELKADIVEVIEEAKFDI